MPKEKGRRPRKLDYLCVSNRWKSMVLNSDVKWGPSIHRFGQQFDHGLLSAKWRWKTKATVKQKRFDFSAMTNQSWPAFDEALRIKLQKEEEPRANLNYLKKDAQGVEEDKVTAELGKKYTRLTKCVYETIKEVVPEKAWIKKNGRVVTKETKKLFEDRSKEYDKNKPTKRRRRKWNKKIRNACRNDYRRWVSEWVQRIEEADNKGDTKAIYRGVKAVSGIGQGGTRTRPTMKTKKKGKKLEELGRFDGPEELAQT